MIAASYRLVAHTANKETKMQNLSPKENYLRCLRHEDYECVPTLAFGPGGDVGMAGFFPSDCGAPVNPA
jgi:hypothetical protein